MSDFDTEFETYARPELLREMGEGTSGTVSYTPDGGSASNIDGIIGDEFTVEDQQFDGRGSRQRRILTISLDDVSSPSVNDEVTISSVAYAVLEVLNEGSGMADLLLARRAEDYIAAEHHTIRRY